LIFADNTQTLAGLADNAGVLASDWRTEGQWGVRGASLSAYAGKAVSSYVLCANQSTPAQDRLFGSRCGACSRSPGVLWLGWGRLSGHPELAAGGPTQMRLS
jgi:hypothetical protein